MIHPFRNNGSATTQIPAAPVAPWRYLLLLLLLTACYLTFELGFNARLLDVVGGAATPKQVEHIEFYGRMLSGTAAALFVLQFMLGRRAKHAGRSPGRLKILLACCFTVVVVFFAIRALVDHLVETSSPAFRRIAVNMVLVQSALSSGSARLDPSTFDPDPGIFSAPEGKAFLALFPAMALSVDKVEEKIRDAKLLLLTERVGVELGGAAAVYHDKFKPMIEKLQGEWHRYRTIPVIGDMDAEIEKQQEQAWARYLRSLEKRQWRPDTVPGYAAGRVRDEVRREVPVPADWQPADEYTFKLAVARKMQRKLNGKRTDGSIVVEGQRIRAGLSFESFLAQPGIQKRLRKEWGLPASVVVDKDYGGSEARFKSEFYQPWLTKLAREQLVNYEAPAETFANGEKNQQLGLDAARAVLVPPIALFFSMAGALGHISKLLYLLLSALWRLAPGGGWLRKWLKPGFVVVGVLVFSLIGLQLGSNRVTDSKLHHYMLAQINNQDAKGFAALQYSLLARTLHAVIIGQGASWPINEAIRTHILHGMNYGYEPAKTH